MTRILSLFFSFFKKRFTHQIEKRKIEQKKRWALYRHCCAFGSSVEKGRPCAIYFWSISVFEARMGEKENERTNEWRRRKKKLISRDRLLPPPPPSQKRMATGRKRSAKKEKTNLPRKRSDVIIIDGATCVKKRGEKLQENKPTNSAPQRKEKTKKKR